MRYIADLHIHSKYSRATSREMDLAHLDLWAKIKGIQILATGDFTHPQWFKDLSSKLQEVKSGLYKLKDEEKLPEAEYKKFGLDRKAETYFLLSSEISCIYSESGKVRRIHLVALAPSLLAVDKLNQKLTKIGNIKSDGRPILGISARNLAQIIFETDPQFMVIPAHVWTPWFSVFGSKSGFDSLEECFGELAAQIYALETGLSSDPAMNWRLSRLDKLTLVSNSDAHSPRNLGREANVLEISPNKLSYAEIYRILAQKDVKKFLYTIEFFPEEGKYHWDGHRTCQKSYPPSETKQLGGICPVCHRPLTVGVLNRVEELADRPDNFKLDTIPYKNLVPLAEIIGEVLDKAVGTKVVQQEYQNLIKAGGDEFTVLLDLSEEQLKQITLSGIAQGISWMRQGKVQVEPGYDGEYGVVKIGLTKRKNDIKQKSLF